MRLGKLPRRRGLLTRRGLPLAVGLLVSVPVWAYSADHSIPWPERRVPVDARQAWPYRPLLRVVPPACGTQPLNPIDAFLAKDSEVHPVTLADKRQRLRRVTFDLIGLPPSPQTLAEWQASDDPLMYERIVDQLLASPHYGERWAPLWLDIVRFAESHGFEHDSLRPTAYHYRDAIIAAANDGLPFREFVRRQIAGDQLAPDDPQAWMLTGFLAAGPHSTRITRREAVRQRYDELDDIVATIGSAILGQSIGCARCHDHPSSPILQADYYRLVATFTKTVRTEITLPIHRERHAAALAVFQSQLQPILDRQQSLLQTRLPQEFNLWRRSMEGQKNRPRWWIPQSARCESDAAQTQLALGTESDWIVTGHPAEKETYTLTLTSDRPAWIRSLQLRAMTSAGLMHGGPGRAPDGNFFLSQWTLALKPPGAESYEDIPLQAVTASFEQRDGALAGVLDERDDTGWGVDPQLGRAHAAMVSLVIPKRLVPGTQVKITLRFAGHPQQSLGRFQVTLSDQDDPRSFLSDAVTEDVWFAWETPLERLTPAMRTAAARWYAPRDAEWAALARQHAVLLQEAPQQQFVSVLAATEGLPPLRLDSQADEEYLPQTEFLERGDPTRPRGTATPGWLSVLDGGKSPSASPVHPRVALANWLVDPDHGAGVLAARVMVNRLWLRHFGEGLVELPNEWSPELPEPPRMQLLDWLAGELLRREGDLKAIQRLIVTSAAYQADRDSSPRELDAEALRDSLLAVSGLLDDRIGGPSVEDSLIPRRSVYVRVRRGRPDVFLMTLGRPDGTVRVGQREIGPSLAQNALWLEHPLVRMAAEHWAKQLASTGPPGEIEWLQAAAAELWQRKLSTEEQQRFTTACRAALQTGATPADLCHALFCLDETTARD